jgi:GntR family transcriptional regulator
LVSTPHIDKASKLPFYVQLKNALLAAIDAGDYQPGDLIPGENELIDRFGVSRTVVRQALTELTNEGRIYRLRGKGSFVSGRKVTDRVSHATLGFFDDLAAAGQRVTNSVFRCETAPAPAPVALRLGIEPGARCLEVERVRYVEGAVVAFMRSYLPLTLGPRMLTRIKTFDLESNSMYRFLEGILGVRVYSGHRTVTAQFADSGLARHLDVAPGAPVLFIESIEKDHDGRPVEYSEAWHRSDRFRLEMEVFRRE